MVMEKRWVVELSALCRERLPRSRGCMRGRERSASGRQFSRFLKRKRAHWVTRHCGLRPGWSMCAPFDSTNIRVIGEYRISANMPEIRKPFVSKDLWPIPTVRNRKPLRQVFGRRATGVRIGGGFAHNADQTGPQRGRYSLVNPREPSWKQDPRGIP